MNWAKVESDPAKLISDDSGSDAEYIDGESQSSNQIWNILNVYVQFIWRDHRQTSIIAAPR